MLNTDNENVSISKTIPLRFLPANHNGEEFFLFFQSSVASTPLNFHVIPLEWVFLTSSE